MFSSITRILRNSDLNAARSGKNTNCNYVKIESKAQTRGDIKTESVFTRENMRKGGEIVRRDRKGEKSCKTTRSGEKARDYFR